MEMLKKRRTLFDEQPNRILWYYGTVRPPELPIDLEVITFQGLPTQEQVDHLKDDFVILDDLMESSKEMLKLFTQVAHHSNVTFFLLVQNFFHLPRSLSLNAYYIVFMANPRDKLQIRILSHQMFPSYPHFLLQAYEDATMKKPYSYLLLDLCVETPEEIRVRSDIFNSNGITVYQPHR